jgi:hypothetical protein
MPITFEEASIALARQLMRAEQAEAKVVELESKLKKLEDETNAKK